MILAPFTVRFLAPGPRSYCSLDTMRRRYAQSAYWIRGPLRREFSRGLVDHSPPRRPFRQETSAGWAYVALAVAVIGNLDKSGHRDSAK